MLNADKFKNDDYDDSTELKKGFKFKNRYCIDEELTPGGQARVFVVLDIINSNEKFVFFLLFLKYSKISSSSLKNKISFFSQIV